ncbi:MAG TPA: hypothetical protein VGP72_00315 [Planctomycetota bacterium]
MNETVFDVKLIFDFKRRMPDLHAHGVRLLAEKLPRPGDVRLTQRIRRSAGQLAFNCRLYLLRDFLDEPLLVLSRVDLRHCLWRRSVVTTQPARIDQMRHRRRFDLCILRIAGPAQVHKGEHCGAPEIFQKVLAIDRAAISRHQERRIVSRLATRLQMAVENVNELRRQHRSAVPLLPIPRSQTNFVFGQVFHFCRNDCVRPIST